jgi:hypothetical protein
MLKSRRNRGTKELLQDATRAGSRVAEQASTQAIEARRRTARKLAQAADAIEPAAPRRRRGRGVVKLVLVGVAGWIAVNVIRRTRAQSDERDVDTELADAKAAATARARAEADKVRAEADSVKAKAKATGTNASTAHTPAK